MGALGACVRSDDPSNHAGEWHRRIFVRWPHFHVDSATNSVGRAVKSTVSVSMANWRFIPGTLLMLSPLVNLGLFSTYRRLTLSTLRLAARFYWPSNTCPLKRANSTTKPDVLISRLLEASLDHAASSAKEFLDTYLPLESKP